MFTHNSNLAFSHRRRLKGVLQGFFNLSLIYFILLLAIRAFEIIYNSVLHGSPSSLLSVIFSSVCRDFIFFLVSSLWLFGPYFILYYFSQKVARNVYAILAAIILLIQLGLVFYFLTALVPLGADLYGYSIAEIKQTVGAAGSLNILSLIAYIATIAFIVFAFRRFFKKMYLPFYVVLILPVLIITAVILPYRTLNAPTHFGNDFLNNLALNKEAYFVHSSRLYFFPPDNDIDIYADDFIGGSSGSTTQGIQSFTYTDPAVYPFLHTDSSADVLAPFFNIDSATKPNIVFVLVEGLGRAFTNEGAYLGNFTPFIDSLSNKSLYWSNFMSEGGRTFAVLPSIIGSLPFGQHGFSELGDKMPHQLSLISLLKYNGYGSQFFYGGNSHFDYMDVFMRHQGIDAVNDESSFGSGYTKMPASGSGFSWGYGDKELFRHYFQLMNAPAKEPYINVLLTVSTHSPFLIDDEAAYLKKFEQRMDALDFSPDEKEHHESYKMQFASILFMDDAVRNFFTEYAKRPDFKNTIFLITGDHRMPEIPMSTKIDRYHVPLIIYSPLLKRTATFQSISTHFDIAPSLLALLRNHYSIKTPTLASWMGTGLDTSRSFRNVHAYPFIQTKDGVSDFVTGDYMLHGQQELYQITPDMGLVPITDNKEQTEAMRAFSEFTNRNNSFIQGAPLIPDSTYRRYTTY
ncbi:LTA synthase family protein [Arachidicoccus sp.]|uniref:LTA synthase family protein n=1 Tax=Arachidicoccus sp. TaxID=1872624 RepID=UPI003D220F6C